MEFCTNCTSSESSDSNVNVTCCSRDNDTDVQDTLRSNPGFVVYCVFLLTVLLLVVAAIWVLTVALVKTKEVPFPLRIFLVNLLMAGFVLACCMLLTIATAAALGASADLISPNVVFCHILLWLYGVGAVARLWGLVAYSLAVFVIIKYGKMKLKLSHITASLVVVWAFSMLINVHVLVPVDVVYAVEYSGGAACFPDYAVIPVPQRYSLLVIWALLGGILPFILSIVVPIFSLCYIKHHNISGEASYNKAIAKFALFLVTGNFINIIGQIGQGLIAVLAFYVAPDSHAEVYVAYGFIVLSLMPTPILIVVFLKPVRQELYKFCLKPFLQKCARKRVFSVKTASIKSGNGQKWPVDANGSGTEPEVEFTTSTALTD